MPSPVLADEYSRLDWRRVSSTNVAAWAYAEQFGRLWVRFRDGGVYVYLDVPPAVAGGFELAASKGRYRHRVLGAYGYRKFS